ncbi:MAG: TolC family protein [Cyanobacteriota bacterium]|nr:TolC family protein [Cyanobacteriota bacterium]
MPVFQNLLAVGVSGIITLTYLGQGLAVSMSVESQQEKSTQDGGSQTSSQHNDVLAQSAQLATDAATPYLPSKSLHYSIKQDSVSDTVEVSIKQNSVKLASPRSIYRGSILNRFTTSPTQENPTLNPDESALSTEFKQNPAKPIVTGSTLQRILDKFIEPTLNEPTAFSLDTTFKENLVKPTTSVPTAQPRILNNFALSAPEELSLNKAESSLLSVFKQDASKPGVIGSSSPSILGRFTTDTVENAETFSLETAFKNNPLKPETPVPTAQPQILNNFALSAPEELSLNKAESSLLSVFKQDASKPVVTGSSSLSILGRFTTDTVDNTIDNTVENAETVSLETAFKENPIKPTTPVITQPNIANNLSSERLPTAEPSDSSVETSLTPNSQQPPTFLPPSPTANRLSLSSTPKPSDSIPVSLSDNPRRPQTATPNLFELSQLLPESVRPPQIAQETNTPVLEVPDLSPPNEPYPPPTPDGTLQTNPPPVTLPSSNLLYTPIQPEEVEIQETVPITLAQAVDLARRNNEGIRVFQLQVEQSLAALRQTQAELYPTLSFISNLTRSFSAAEDIANSARNREIEARTTGQQAISLSRTFGVTLFDNSFQFQYDFDLSGARGARIRASEEQLRLARLEFERSVEQLRLDVTEAYYNLQEADAEVEIQRAAVRNAQKSLEDAEALERAGVGTRFEVLQARVTLSRVQQDATNAISNQRTRRRELSNILNVSQNVNLIAADAIALAGAWDLTLDQSIVLAYNNRAELEQELVNRNLAEQQRIAARAAQRPNLVTTATYNVLGRLSDNSDPFANQGWADGYTIQMQLRWDFFDGGLAKANARQQEVSIAIAEERYSELRNDIRLEVESAFYDLQATFENIGVANLGVEEATEALRLARLRFQAGVGTQLDVINQETDLTRAQNQLLQAIIGYNRSLSRLQRAVSNLPGSNLQHTP